MLIVSNKNRSKKQGETDALFHSEFLVEEPELFDEVDRRKVGLPSILKYGTAESGNWGHQGRPGQVGGSGEGVGPVEDARDARHAERLGLERATRGEDGKWRMADGKPLPMHIQKELGGPIPPAWRNVYVNPSRESCLKGVYAVRARDGVGNTKGLYLKKVLGENAEAKHARVAELDSKMTKVIDENTRNLTGPNKENASVLRLIIDTACRPGSDDDTKAAAKAYGAVTLLGKHVFKTAEGVELRFPAKKGTFYIAPIFDKAVAKDILARASKAGKNGQLFDTNYMSLWKYTKKLDGQGFLPKDFRTLAGTRLAVEAMKKIKPPTNEKEYKKAVGEVANIVSGKLRNTPTVALQHYINPTVFGSWRGNWGGKKKMLGISSIIKIGNENSGNWGHEGRPGERGGSGPGGGLHRRPPPEDAPVHTVEPAPKNPEPPKPEPSSQKWGMDFHAEYLSKIDALVKETTPLSLRLGIMWKEVGEMRSAAYRANPQGYLNDLAHNERAMALSREIDEVQNKVNELVQKQDTLIRDMLRQPEGDRVTITARLSIGKNNSPEFEKWAQGHFSELQQFLHKDAVYSGGENFGHVFANLRVEPGVRASYSYAASTITMGGKDKGTLFHEFGHQIEHYNKAAYNAVKSFRNERTANDKPEKLSKVTGIKSYRQDEMTKKDKFIDPYVGKIYRDGATEVVSMGIERMMSSPVTFARKDPEHFALIADIMRGRYASRQKGIGAIWPRR